jgi:tryptophanyl-tRNA synthetase
MHIGNYLGAICNWVKLQANAKENDQNIFSIVDLHALSDKFKTGFNVFHHLKT